MEDDLAEKEVQHSSAAKGWQRVRRSTADGQTVIDAAVQVDARMPFILATRGRRNSRNSGAGVGANQDEPGNMAKGAHSAS